MYHEIGHEILDRQNRQGWGDKVIDRLSADLREAFPDMKDLSASNLKYMRFFAQECPDRTIGQQPAVQLPWFHIVILITNDKPTLGLLLCKTKKKMMAEYALSGIDKPIIYTGFGY